MVTLAPHGISGSFPKQEKRACGMRPLSSAAPNPTRYRRGSELHLKCPVILAWRVAGIWSGAFCCHHSLVVAMFNLRPSKTSDKPKRTGCEDDTLRRHPIRTKHRISLLAVDTVGNLTYIFRHVGVIGLLAYIFMYEPGVVRNVPILARKQRV